MCAIAVAMSPVASAKDCWFAPIRFVRVDGPRLYVELMLPCAGKIPVGLAGKSSSHANSLYLSESGRSMRIAVLIDKAFCKPAAKTLHQYSYVFGQHVAAPAAKFRGSVDRLPYPEYAALETDACVVVPQ